MRYVGPDARDGTGLQDEVYKSFDAGICPRKLYQALMNIYCNRYVLLLDNVQCLFVIKGKHFRHWISDKKVEKHYSVRSEGKTILITKPLNH
jgi:hypothetical protein